MEERLITGDGMRVVANYPKRPGSSLPASSDVFAIVDQSRFKRRYHCNHRGSRWVVVNTYGQLTKRLDLTRWGRCPACFVAFLKQHIIRCARCGLPIEPGAGVALYSNMSEGLRLDVATTVGENQVIGCLRWDCCPSGGFFAGNWSEDGFAPRFGGRTAVDAGMITLDVLLEKEGGASPNQ